MILDDDLNVDFENETSQLGQGNQSLLGHLIPSGMLDIVYTRLLRSAQIARNVCILGVWEMDSGHFLCLYVCSGCSGDIEQDCDFYCNINRID